MFNLGLFELTLFGIIALIVLGPEKLPEAARSLGKWYAFIKHTKERLQNEVTTELRLLETQEALKAELEKLRQNENSFKQELNELRSAIEKNQPASQNDTTSQNSDDSGNGFHQGILSETMAQLEVSKPMYGRFFLLSDYDKARRLPSAPMLPNYHPDPLLNQKPSSQAITTNSQSTTQNHHPISQTANNPNN